VYHETWIVTSDPGVWKMLERWRRAEKAVQVAVFRQRFLKSLESHILAEIPAVGPSLRYHAAPLPTPTNPDEHVRQLCTQQQAMIVGRRRPMQVRKGSVQVRVIAQIAQWLLLNQMCVFCSMCYFMR
jgi:hypothetical protein